MIFRSTRLGIFSIDSIDQLRGLESLGGGGLPVTRQSPCVWAQSLTVGPACLHVHAAYRLLNVIIIRHSSASNDKKRESMSKLLFIAVGYHFHCILNLYCISKYYTSVEISFPRCSSLRIFY